ncbi:TatA/E family twin arginine-targeting protein translocase [Leptolyngbya sp. PCC 6406]|uniref:TatA/E family twin arginine-targeting protein translocase n=1 Tax=Leptolyngbya sp. PCC 6406 TaxID=1173264 RepID=UPI0002AC761B|nr:TatA/E family twin arginine-targeting protein translocase [Leptolyngbya sp. PCC 6406]
MNFFGIGLPEMALILVIALLVFGPKKLPEIGSSLAKALKSFQKAQQDFEAEFKREAEELQKSVTEPMKASLEKPEPKALAAQNHDQNGAAVAGETPKVATDLVATEVLAEMETASDPGPEDAPAEDPQTA